MDIQYLQNQSAKFEQIRERDSQTDKSQWPVFFHAINNAALNLVKIFDDIIKNDLKEISDGTRTEISRNLFFAKKLIHDVKNSSFGSFADPYKDSKEFETLEDLISDLDADFEIASSSEEDSSKLLEINASFRGQPINQASLRYQNLYFINSGDDQSDLLEFDSSLGDDISLVQTRLLESFSVFGTMPQPVLLQAGARLEFDQESLEAFNGSVFKLDFGPYGFQLQDAEGDKRNFGFYVNDGFKIDGVNGETLEHLFKQTQLLDFDYELSQIMADFSATNLQFRLDVNNHHRLNNHESQDGEIFSYLSTSYQEAGAS